MMFKIEEIPKTRIAYMRQVGPYGANNKELMERLKNWAEVNNLMRDDAIILGIVQNDPAITPPENCRYDVGIVIPEDCEITDVHIKKTALPGGRYAVFAIKHAAADIQKAWSEIFTELASGGYRADASKPVFERYVPSMVNHHQCEICIPIC